MDHLDVDLMIKGASYLIGKHDFTSFRATQCQASTPIKTISNIEITRNGDNIEIYYRTREKKEKNIEIIPV